MKKLIIVLALISGCSTIGPASRKEMVELKKAEKAAIEAEKELYKLRMERIKLEEELENK